MSEIEQSGAAKTEAEPQTGTQPAPWRLNRPVVLVGMMGAGKTAVGRAVAARLQVPFLDSDTEIETAANMSIAEIFARDGEAFFRRKESQVIERLLIEKCGILSTGGGAFLSPEIREIIARHGVAIWLNAPLEVLWNRVRHRTHRPLLQTENPRGTLQALFQARTPVYALADISVPSDAETSIDAMADRVIAALSAHDAVLEPV